MLIEFITDLLDEDEQAVAVVTRGPEFHRNPDNTGYTGLWPFAPQRVASGFFHGITVLVYLQANSQNTIFRGQCTGVRGPFEDDRHRLRYRLLLTNIEALGTTNSSWFVSANTCRQDFAYFNHQSAAKQLHITRKKPTRTSS